MDYIAPFVVLPLLAGWFVAERRKTSFAGRIGLGISCLLACTFAARSLALFIPKYESNFHKSSLNLASELLSRGDTQRVQQAISAYNTVAATGNTYRASMALWEVLNNGPK